MDDEIENKIASNVARLSNDSTDDHRWKEHTDVVFFQISGDDFELSVERDRWITWKNGQRKDHRFFVAVIDRTFGTHLANIVLTQGKWNWNSTDDT